MGVRDAGPACPDEQRVRRAHEHLGPHAVEQRIGAVRGLGQLGAQLLQVLGMPSLRQHSLDGALGIFRAADGGEDLEVGQILRQIGAAGHEAHAQRGRQRLGEAAQVERALEPVQRRQARRRGGAVVAEGIVLDQQQVVLLRQPQHRLRLGLRQVRARGVVRQRLREEEARAFGLEHVFQRLQVGAVRQARHAHDPGAGQVQLAQQRVVAGVVDQHHAARRHEVAHDQVHGLVGAVGQHDLLRVGVDAHVRQAPHEAVAQRRIAQPVAVAEQRAQPAARHLVVRAVQPRPGQPFGRWEGVAHRQLPRLVAQLHAHEPDDVHGPAPRRVVGALAALVGLVHGLLDEEARAAPGLHQPPGHQQLEGRDHRVLAVAARRRDLAQRGQLVAAAVHAVADLPVQRIRQGDEQGRGRGAHVPALYPAPSASFFILLHQPAHHDYH